MASSGTSRTYWPPFSAANSIASGSISPPSALTACMSRCATAMVRGTYRRAITLVSGKFAITQRDEHFTLVPWRALLERQRGREVVGIVRGMGVSWQLGMHRDRGLSR